MQVIGIIGDDHCGSTALARALAALPGIQSAGELHWLADIEPGQAAAMRAGWAVTRACRVHGATCLVFDATLRTEPLRHRDVYARVMRQLSAAHEDTRYMVASDKYPAYYQRVLPPKAMLGVVMFKSPIEAGYSQIKTNHKPLEESLQSWLEIYATALMDMESFCHRLVWISHAGFARDPHAALQRIADTLKLDVPVPAHPTMASDYHFLGGNAGAQQATEICHRPRARQLTMDETTFLRSDPHVNAVYSQLQKRESLQLQQWTAAKARLP